MDLTVKDLRQVRALLFKARDKWYSIGIELEIDVEQLNIINNKFDDPGDKLVHMLQVWLKQFDPQPTWKTLASALMADAVNEVPIAEEASALDNQRSAQIQAGLVPLALTPPPTSPAAHHEVPQEGLQDLNTGQISGNEPQQERDQATGSYSPEGPVLVNKGGSASKTWQLRGISSHASYHGVMSSKKAESKLKMQNTDCYLTRYSENRDQYTLSVCTRKGTFQNFKIIIEKNSEGEVTYEISGTEEKFPDIAALLAFYKKNPLNPHIEEIGEELVSERRMSSTTTQDDKAIMDCKDNSSKESVKSNLYLVQKQEDGKLAFICKETGKSFSDSSDFLTYCESEVVRSEEGESMADEEPFARSKIYYQKSVSREELNKGVPSHVMSAMSKHPSFHGSITRVDATTLLLQKGKKCYLTRYSDYHKTCVISVLRTTEDGELLQHFKLDIIAQEETTTYEISSTTKRFNSISTLLDYYQKHPINRNIDSFGECVECKFTRAHQKRLSSIDLMRVHSGGLTEVTEETENPEEEGTKEATSSEPETLLEETTQEEPTKKKERVVKAVPGWKIREIGTLNSFHGPLDMDEAETRLRRAGKDRCYLTRYSESIEEHILSVLRRKNDDDLVLQHFCIAIQLEGQLAVSYEILGSTKKFKSITGLLEFYKKNPLNHKIDSTGDKIERDVEVCVQDIADVKHIENYMGREDQDCAVPQWVLTKMDSHPSFHGSITRQEAVKKLIDAGRSCYLTRYSDYNKFCVISMLNLSDGGELMQHLELQIPQDSSQMVYKVAGTDKEFDSISKLLEHYQKHPLNQTECLGEHIPYQNDAIGDQEESNEAVQEEISPTRANLSRITYKDDEGKTHDFKLLELVADKWRRAATLLAFSKDKRGNDAECCKHIFSKWIKKGGRNEYPLTWVGLHRLLFDMGKRSVAEKLYKVLKYKETNKIKYVDTMSKLQ